MGMNVLRQGFEVMEWDPLVYDSLPMDRKAFQRVKERQASEDVFSEIRSASLSLQARVI